MCAQNFREISFLCVWNFYFSSWNMGPTLYMMHLYFCSVYFTHWSKYAFLIGHPTVWWFMVSTGKISQITPLSLHTVSSTLLLTKALWSLVKVVHCTGNRVPFGQHPRTYSRLFAFTGWCYWLTSMSLLFSSVECHCVLLLYNGLTQSKSEMNGWIEKVTTEGLLGNVSMMI